MSIPCSLHPAALMHASGCIVFNYTRRLWLTLYYMCNVFYLRCYSDYEYLFDSIILPADKGMGAERDCNAWWTSERYNWWGWKGKGLGKRKRTMMLDGIKVKDQNKMKERAQDWKNRLFTYHEYVPVVQCATMYYPMSDKFFLNSLTFCRKIHNFDSVLTNHWLA